MFGVVLAISPGTEFNWDLWEKARIVVIVCARQKRGKTNIVAESVLLWELL